MQISLTNNGRTTYVSQLENNKKIWDGKCMRIMFICTGNICRSAMAHKLFEKITNGKDVQIFSCGVYAQSGDSCTDEAKSVMKQYNVDMTVHRATNIVNSYIENMDVILCATTAHKINVRNMYPELAEKIFTMKEYAGYPKNDLDIKDPWGCNFETYERCAREISDVLQKINEKI